MKEIINTMQQKHKQAGERGGRAEKVSLEDEEEQGTDRGQGDGGRRRGEKEDRSRGATSEGGEGGKQPGRLRQRVHQLEKEKLELTSSHNQEVRSKGHTSSAPPLPGVFSSTVCLRPQLCRLQADLARLRSSVERGEAQRVALQYQLTVSQRDGERVSELSKDKHTLTGDLNKPLLQVRCRV